MIVHPLSATMWAKCLFLFFIYSYHLSLIRHTFQVDNWVRYIVLHGICYLISGRHHYYVVKEKKFIRHLLVFFFNLKWWPRILLCHVCVRRVLVRSDVCCCTVAWHSKWGYSSDTLFITKNLTDLFTCGNFHLSCCTPCLPRSQRAVLCDAPPPRCGNTLVRAILSHL